MNPVSLKAIFRQYKFVALLLAIVFIWAFFSWKTGGGFVSPRNLSNLLRQMSITGLLACGMVLIIIAGEIDLSVGSMLGLLGGVAALLDVVYQLPLAWTLLLVLMLGLALGIFNGYCSAYLGIPSFIVGLGGMLAFRGILLGLTGGVTIAPVSEQLVYLGQGYLPASAGVFLGAILFGISALLIWQWRKNRRQHQLPLPPGWRSLLQLLVLGIGIAAFVRILNQYEGIPVPVLLLLGFLAALSYLTTQTVFGRRIYAVGSNTEASRLSGLNVRAIKASVFALMGLMCGFAGLLNTARLAAGSPSAGMMGELDAIAACFIGGASMKGGSGTVYGALIGALVMASLDNGMSMLDVDAYWQMIVKGSILMLAVWMDVSTRLGR